MTSMPAAHFGLWDRGLLRAGLRGRRRRLRLRRPRRGLDGRRPAPLRDGASSTCSSTAPSSSTAASTRARGPGGTCCDGRDRPPLRSLLGSDRRDVGGDAGGRARLGDRSARTRRVNLLCERAADAARQAGRPSGCRPAGWRTSPRCSRSASRATASCSRPPRTSSPPRRWGSRDRPARAASAVGGRRADGPGRGGGARRRASTPRC